MNLSPQPMVLPAMASLLSGLEWNESQPGTALSVTYNFLQQFPSDIQSYELVGVTGNQATNFGFAPFTANQQSLALQALQTISAVADITFIPSHSDSAQILMGTDNQTVTWGQTSYGAGYPVMSQDLITVNNGSSNGQTITTAGDFIAAFIHEVQNSTGISDSVPADVVSFSYPYGPAQFEPSGWSAVTPQISAIAAWQYLYGANQNDFTFNPADGANPAVSGTSATLSKGELTYRFTDLTAPQVIWVGANVASVCAFNFANCSGVVTIDLTAGTQSSTGETAPDLHIILNGQDELYANHPFENVGIALNTQINVGIANNVSGAQLYADIAKHNDILIGGAGGDTFNAGGGKDIFVASGGANTVVFHDSASSYTITDVSPGVTIVTDNAANPIDGAVVLDGGFSTLQFADKSLTEAGSPTPTTTITASAAVISGNFNGLGYLVDNGMANKIVVTDGGTITLSASQLNSDAGALADLGGSFSLVVDPSAAGLTLTGVAWHACTAQFNGPSNQFSIVSDGNGGFNLTDNLSGQTGGDHLTGFVQVQFSDRAITLEQANSVGEEIALLYQAALGRTPDATGVVSWTNQAAFALPTSVRQEYGVYALSNASGQFNGTLSIAAGFTNSAEFQAKYGNLTDAQFVTQLYANVLDRAPDAAGLASWEQALTPVSQGGKGETRDYVLVGFAESAEAIANATNGFSGQSGQHQAWLFLS